MKYVFLDQFVWINLRNSLCEKGYSRLFDYLRSKADGGECCFPLFLEHVQETQATPSQKTRIQLALIMLQLCREYAIRHFSRLKDFEIDAMYMNRNSWESPEQVIRPYYGNMFGRQKEETFDSLMQEYGIAKGSENYQVLSSLVHTTSSAVPFLSLMSQYRENNKESDISTIEWYRTEKPKSVVHVCQDTMGVYFSKSQCSRINEYINEHCSCDYGDKGFREKEAVFQKLPTFYTNCALLYKDVNMYPENTAMHKNDFIDMLYLSEAIPYCDIVVTEKKWVSLAKQAKLDKLYDTILLSKVDDLPLWL